MNQSIITQLNSLQDEVNEYTNEYSGKLRTNFSLSDLEFHEGGSSIDGKELSKNALKNLLSLFQVKDKFISSQNAKLLGATEIANFINTIKGLNTGDRLFCSYDDITNPKNITDVWLSSDRNNGSFPDYNAYFEIVKEKLNETEIEFNIDKLNFDKPSGSISLSLLTDDTFNVGSNNDNNLDEWRNGLFLDFNLFTTQVAPFYSRLICSNGMISREYMKTMNLNHAKYSQAKLDNLTEKFIIKGNFRETQSLIWEKCQIANDTPMSVLELEFAKSLLPESLLESNDEVYDKFNLDTIANDYMVDLSEKSTKWKATAAINKTVYEVVNNLTWISARPEEYGITQKEAEHIQLNSSNILLKKRYDMEDIAPNPYNN